MHLWTAILNINYWTLIYGFFRVRRVMCFFLSIPMLWMSLYILLITQVLPMQVSCAFFFVFPIPLFDFQIHVTFLLDLQALPLLLVHSSLSFLQSRVIVLAVLACSGSTSFDSKLFKKVTNSGFALRSTLSSSFASLLSG